MKTWYAIKAAKDNEPPVVSILDYIGYYGVEAPKFLADYRAAVKDAKRVTLQISTPGGDVMQGLAIFNGIKAAKVPVDVEVLGIAASMGSYLAMVGETVTMPDNTFMFLHDPIGGVRGNAEDMRGAAQDLDKVATGLYAGYLARWKGTEDEFRAVMAGETLLTAAECLAHGLCDTVTPAVEAVAAVDLEMLAPSIREKVGAAMRRANPAPAPASRPSAPAAAPAAALADQIIAACTAAGLAEYAAYFATAENADDMAKVQPKIDAARELHALCVMIGQPNEARPLIVAGKSLVEARAHLNERLVAIDAATAIRTAQSSAALQSPGGAAGASDSPAAIWKHLNAGKAGSSTC